MNARETGIVQLVALISVASNGRRWYTFQEEVARTVAVQGRSTEVASSWEKLQLIVNAIVSHRDSFSHYAITSFVHCQSRIDITDNSLRERFFSLVLRDGSIQVSPTGIALLKTYVS